MDPGTLDPSLQLQSLPQEYPPTAAGPPSREPASDPLPAHPLGPTNGALRVQPALVKRRRRNPDEVAADQAAKDARTAARDKAKADKAEMKRQRDVERAVKARLAAQAKADRTARFLWTDGATEELLELVQHLKNEHEVANAATPGFIPWSKFFKDNSDRKSQYVELADLTFDTLERRYKALLTTYRTIHDSCMSTGGAGFLPQLERYHMSESVYNTIGDLHSCNPALQASGGHTLSEEVSQADAGADGITPEPTTPQAWSRSPSVEPAIDESRAMRPMGAAEPEAAHPSSGAASPVPRVVFTTESARPPRARINPRAQRLTDISTAVSESNASIGGSLAALLLLQQQAQVRGEEREARERLERERTREARERERAEARREREEQRVEERKNNQLMQAMMLGMLGKLTGQQAQSVPDAGPSDSVSRFAQVGDEDGL